MPHKICRTNQCETPVSDKLLLLQSKYGLGCYGKRSSWTARPTGPPCQRPEPYWALRESATMCCCSFSCPGPDWSKRLWSTVSGPEMSPVIDFSFALVLREFKGLFFSFVWMPPSRPSNILSKHSVFLCDTKAVWRDAANASGDRPLTSRVTIGKCYVIPQVDRVASSVAGWLLRAVRCYSVATALWNISRVHTSSTRSAVRKIQFRVTNNLTEEDETFSCRLEFLSISMTRFCRVTSLPRARLTPTCCVLGEVTIIAYLTFLYDFVCLHRTSAVVIIHDWLLRNHCVEVT